jgi:hypothetical protein
LKPSSHALRSLFGLYLVLVAVSCTAPLVIPASPSPASPSAPVSPVPTPTSNPFTLPSTISIPLSPSPQSPARSSTQPPAVDQESPTPILPQASPIPPKRALYRLDASLDYSQHILSVSETITYTNNSAGVIGSLLLMVEPARQAGVFQLLSIRGLANQPISPLSFEDGQITLPLRLSPAETLPFSIDYELHLQENPGVLGFTSRQVNLGDWYPFIPPYKDGSGWQAHTPASVGEFLVYDASDFEVSLRLLNAPPHTLVAASAAAQMQGAVYRYRLTAARSFAWTASDRYQVFKAVAQTPSGVVQVNSYVFPEHAQAGERAAQVSAQALSLYAQLFGPAPGGNYPHSSLAVVEADFFDGMEYDGLYFLSREYYDTYDGTSQNYLVSLSAHETSHQWWYGIVGNDQALEPWLDEALATYSECLYYEHYYPDLVPWWWGYRVNRFIPEGWVDSTIYDYGYFRQYVNAVYLRGALFLGQMRVKVGDETFFGALREYTAVFAGRQASTRDFFDILIKHTTVDLNPLVSVYFKANP